MPEFALIFSVFFSVYGWILLKRIIYLRYSVVLANGLSMLLGGVICLCHSYFSGEKWDPFPVNDFACFSLYTIVSCFISNIVCYNLFGFLLRFFSVTFMNFAGLVTPIFALALGWFFLGEAIKWSFFVSLFIFAAGLCVFFAEEKRTACGNQKNNS